MSEPLIFVTTATINEGEFETITALSAALIARAEAGDAGLVAYHFHLSDDGSSVSNVQVHADAASMDAYLLVAQEQIAKAVELTTITSIDVFGTPGPVLQQAIRHNAEQGVPVRVVPTHLNGLTRGAAA
jgi:hypothetical protein